MKKINKVAILAVSMLLLVCFTACNKKKEVSADKVTQTIIQEVIAEQRDSGNVLTVDTIFLNKGEGDNFVGELRGHINDSTEIVYDLNVVDLGTDLEAEWTQRK